VWRYYNTPLILVDGVSFWRYNNGMIQVKSKTKTKEFETLDLAMSWAKHVNEFVTITVNGMEIVGRFGADSIVDGKCPDGVDYTWRKRRI
jgi:hypothetical protein